MSVDNIPSRANSQTIDQTWFNILQAVLGTDIVPRTSGGVVTDLAGSLGESSSRFLSAQIACGYFKAGNYMMHNSYNGAAPIGEGWMLCDGRQVTSAAYDTEHGAGHYTTFITPLGGSPLLNKYLPNFTANNGVYAVGSATTTQDGSAPLSTTGHASHQVNLNHSHTVNAHQHRWLLPANSVSTIADETYGGAGGLNQITNVNNPSHDVDGIASILDLEAKIAAAIGPAALTMAKLNHISISGDMYSEPISPGTDAQLSSTTNIQPESFGVLIYMRII